MECLEFIDLFIYNSNIMGRFQSTKIIELGSCAFRQPYATSHCRFLHGYRLYGKFWFGCNELDENNWVVDFGSLKGLKKKLEKQFDHTTVIAKHDPALNYFKDLANEDICDLRVMDGVGIEKFAEWCFNTAHNYVFNMTSGRCGVERVEVWEHEKNSAAYVGPFTDPVPGDERQQELDLRLDHGEPLEQPPEDTNKDPHQHKTTNKWVDPNVANKPNSWLF